MRGVEGGGGGQLAQFLGEEAVGHDLDRGPDAELAIVVGLGSGEGLHEQGTGDQPSPGKQQRRMRMSTVTPHWKLRRLAPRAMPAAADQKVQLEPICRGTGEALGQVHAAGD
jgi:hypothetical protein